MEDLVVIKSEEDQHGRPSNLPKSFIEALSAIQEMSFIEATRDDPESYSQIFSLAHKLHFFWAGFTGAAFDVFLSYFGVLFFGLASVGVLSMFGNVFPGVVEYIFGLLLATLPFLATFLLVVKIFSGVSGTISKKMSFWLAAGFFVGCSLCAVFLFLGGSAVVYDYADSIYTSLSGIDFLYPLADMFWEKIRGVLAKTAWRELIISCSAGSFVLLIYAGKAIELWRKRRNAELR